MSYEKEVDIDKQLNNYLKITGIINNVFRPQKTLKEKNKIVQYISSSTIRQWKLDHYSKKHKKNNSSRDEVYQKNSGIHMDGLWNEHRDCRINHNSSFEQNTGPQKKF